MRMPLSNRKVRGSRVATVLIALGLAAAAVGSTAASSIVMASDGFTWGAPARAHHA